MENGKYIPIIAYCLLEGFPFGRLSEKSVSARCVIQYGQGEAASKSLMRKEQHGGTEPWFEYH